MFQLSLSLIQLEVCEHFYKDTNTHANTLVEGAVEELTFYQNNNTNTMGHKPSSLVIFHQQNVSQKSKSQQQVKVHVVSTHACHNDQIKPPLHQHCFQLI